MRLMSAHSPNCSPKGRHTRTFSHGQQLICKWWELDFVRTGGESWEKDFCPTNLPHNNATNLRKSLILLDSYKMAGAAGFEPAHGGIKSRCLTAWRRPSTVSTRRRRAGWWALYNPVASEGKGVIDGFLGFFCTPAARHELRRVAGA